MTKKDLLGLKESVKIKKKIKKKTAKSSPSPLSPSHPELDFLKKMFLK